MKLGILNDFKNQHKILIDACIDLGIDYVEIDIISDDWIRNIVESECDGFMVKPPGRRDEWKRMYDERLYFIEKVLNRAVYPPYEEVFLYENKRVMYYWLKVNKISHPNTWVFYTKKEAITFLNSFQDYPLLFKANIASGGVGIENIENRKQGLKLVNKIFTKFNFYNRGYTKWNTKHGIPYPMLDDKQYDNILLQKKIDVKWEWRGVKIGESYFAHKKLPGNNGMHSGSGKANYDTPTKEVMNFLKHVCDIGNFRSMNVDFFETENGDFYVNELQTYFGSKIKPYQMCVSGKPGRYLYIDENWVFEEGLFNANNSCNLRVQDFVNILEGK